MLPYVPHEALNSAPQLSSEFPDRERKEENLSMHQTTSMAGHHRLRRPKQQQQQQQQQQHDQERLQQVLSRLQSALNLGLRPTSQLKTGDKKWYNTDAEVQLQAARAVFAFVLTLSSQHGRPTLPQVLVEESVAALEGLLAAEREVVYSKAADAASGLVAAMGDGLLGYGGERLVGPLAQLLKCSKLPTSISAATALHGIFAKVKPRTASKGSEDGMWGALEDADALGIIVRTVEEESGNSGKDAAFMQLLAVIMERWSESRYRIGCIKSFPATLQLRCMSSSELVSQAALHALSALALCGCAASILLQNAGSLWSTISLCVQLSKPYSIRLEALRLLTLLSKIPTFGASFSGPHVQGIAAGCSRSLEQARNLGEMRWAPEVETLVVGAAHATSSVLSWPGLHHIAFVQNGIEESLLIALSGMESRRGDTDPPEQHHPLNSAVDRRSRGNKLNPRLRPLLWEIVGWLGAHSNAQLGPHSSSTVSEQKVLSTQLPAVACVAFSKALRKRGRSPDWYGTVHKFEADLAQTDAEAKIKEEQPVNAQEVVQICKTVLLLISSSSPAIASCTKRCLEDTFVAHGFEWLPSLVTTLTLAGSKTIKTEHVQTMTNLLAVACVSWLDICQEQLLQLKALEVVLEIIKEHIGDVDQETTEKLSLMTAPVYPIAVKACCLDGQTWEGYDAVLFCALWAYFRLLLCSGWAKKIRESLTLHMLDNLAWDDINEGEIVHLLWTVAGDKQKSAGVRWFGACCLTCFGIYGFPTIVGNDMKNAMDDSSSADLVFVLGDGSRLFAHAVMLIARCKSLLPANVQSKVPVSSDASDLESSRQSNPKMVHFHHSSGRTNQERADPWRSGPAKVQVSPRVTHGSLKALLEFVYTGIVWIPLDLMAEVKILAKRCNLEPLMSLLHGKSPVWGQPPAPYDLSLTLESEGYLVSDISLRAQTSLSELLGEKLCNACNVVADHLHAHRIVLSARCSYFQALFRSGMRDSVQEELKVPARLDTIEKFLLYLYSAELIKEGVSNCAWRHSGTDAQLGFLESLVELAEVAGQWVLEDLQQLTVALIGKCLHQNIHLCPPILSLAADKQLWAIVDLCATCLAPVYPQLRDSSALDDLREELKDLVRAANVKLFMM